jgi:hypothetical protein
MDFEMVDLGELFDAPEPITIFTVTGTIELTDEQFSKYCTICECIDEMEELVRNELAITTEEYVEKRNTIINRLTKSLLLNY